VYSRCEPACGQDVADQRRVGKVPGRNSEVGVGGVFGNGEIRVGGVEVNGLGAYEHDSVEVLF